MDERIFVNYRRDDDPGFVQALFGRLEVEFGHERLFMDVSGIRPGDDFIEVIERKVTACDVLLAVIGQKWLSIVDHNGQRRIDDPNDFVRLEISVALKRGKRVIPILVNNAVMPRSQELPQDLVPLARRNAVRLTHERFASDCHDLISQVRAIFLELEETRENTTADNSTDRGASLAEFRRSFWTHFLNRHPTEQAFGAAQKVSSRWRPVMGANLIVAQYLSKKAVGVFIRGKRGADPKDIAERLSPAKDVIADRIGAKYGNEPYLFHKWVTLDANERSNWDRMADWLKQQADLYENALRQVSSRTDGDFLSATNPIRSIELLDQLQLLGFNDEAFAALHHFKLRGKKATITAHRTYCAKRNTFQLNRRNALVQRRLEMVLNTFRAGGHSSGRPEVFIALAETAFRDLPPCDQNP